MSNDAVKRNVEHLMKLASAQDVNETAQHDIDGTSHLIIPFAIIRFDAMVSNLKFILLIMIRVLQINHMW